MTLKRNNQQIGVLSETSSQLWALNHFGTTVKTYNTTVEMCSALGNKDLGAIVGDKVLTSACHLQNRKSAGYSMLQLDGQFEMVSPCCSRCHL